MDSGLLTSVVDEDDVRFAQLLADRARTIALTYFRAPNGLALKGDGSPVTRADQEIEEMIRAEIEARYPSDGIFGEETGVTGADRDRVWVVDPIDGTGAFATGSPLFGVLLCLCRAGEPEFGLIDAGAMDERWVARRGAGTTMNGTRCRTSHRTRLSEASIAATSIISFAADARAGFERLATRAAVTRFGGDCYAYGLLALGQLDAVVETGLKPYDYMPLIPIIEEAGGIITDWNGQRLGLQSDGDVVAAANTELHAEILDLLHRP